MTMSRLANAEFRVMEVLWDGGPLTARRIQERLYDGAEKPQHGTVQKLLCRLEEKGFVQRERGVPAHLFSARITRETYAGNQLEEIAERMTGGALFPLISSLIDRHKITPEEIARLRRRLDEYTDEGGE